ncbi:hypothetical protein GRI39_01625 [Altererythrobacter indicus]|uniref:Secreted protein n=1 Tax=Altericroceibacterium indicum TaxID=374177 RepID=A0A845A7F3_9SPHN|nr:hypothetical protein [Altericroceibacterium indicum]MXP24745.1 hypothetical protein [Altericroceibacterium indicum]
MMKFAMGALASAMILAACSPSTAPETPAQTTGPKLFLSQQEQRDCTETGGTVEKRGRLQAEVCVHPFADAGESCTDSSTCDGKCIVKGNSGEGHQVAGTCQADDHLFGCYAEVENGKAVRSICVD